MSMAARSTSRFAELTPLDRLSCSRRVWARFHRTGTGFKKNSLRLCEASVTTVPGLAGAVAAAVPGTPQTIAMELRDALREAAIEPPYVLAGHSFGGLPVRAFADLYPELTAGLVLVDASHPDQWVRWPTPHADRMLEVSQRIFGWLGWLGVLRALNLSRGITAGLPARQAAELRAGAALPGFAATEAAQIRSWSVSREQLNAAGPLGDLPLAVLAVSEQPVGGELLTALQRELAELTKDASFEVVQGASHESLIANREHARIVAKTIESVVQAARNREESRLKRP